MVKHKLRYKVGEVFRVTARQSAGNGAQLQLVRQGIRGLSEELNTLLAGEIVVTALPGCPAVCIYSAERWDALLTQIMGLASREAENRQLQRLMLGHAAPYRQTEPLLLDEPLVRYAELDSRMIMIVFGDDNAELWSERQLELMAGLVSEGG